MPPVQTSYPGMMRPAVAGMVANSETQNVITRENSGEDPIGFGQPVIRDGEHGAVIADGEADVLGITVRDTSLDVTAGDEFLEGVSMPVMTLGVIWVEAGETVAAGADVYWDAANGQYFSTAGELAALTGWVFDNDGVADGLVKIARR